MHQMSSVHRHVLALMLACALTLPLTGCFTAFNPSGAANTADDFAAAASDFADQMTEMADALSSVEWNKVSRLTLYDAQTGEQLAEVPDQAEIESVFAGLAGVNNLAAAPDAATELRAEVWQPATIKAGEAKPNGEVKVLELTTYEDSDVVTLTVSPIGLELCFSAPETAASVRALAATSARYTNTQ